MNSHRIFGRGIAAAMVLGLVLTLIPFSPASAAYSRTSGDGHSVDVSWTEYDAEDLLGLPGNVHVGFLYASTDQYGTYFYGNIIDFDCDDGEVPWGGHGLVIDEASDIAADASQDVIDDVVDSDSGEISADDVIDAIQEELSESIPEVIADEFEEFPACDYIQARYLDGGGTAIMTVDTKKEIATITGTVSVSNGGHGEPSTILGSPPLNITISGGSWQQFDQSYSARGADYRYSYSQRGTSFYGGTVTGAIGAMGFDDDADDVSYGGFSTYKYNTVERVR